MNDPSCEINFKNRFACFAKCRELNSNGDGISLLQSDKWMMQARIIDGKQITTTDTCISFNKLRLKKITFHDYIKFIKDLAQRKRISPDEIIIKLSQCEVPSSAHKLKERGEVFDRLTAPKYLNKTHKHVCYKLDETKEKK